MNFADNLRKTRIFREMTQRELADAVSVEKNTVYKWEKGQASPSVESVYRLATALGVSPGALLGEEQTEPAAQKGMGVRNYEKYEQGSIIIECERSEGKSKIKVIVPPGMNEKMLDRILKRMESGVEPIEEQEIKKHITGKKNFAAQSILSGLSGLSDMQNRQEGEEQQVI